MALIGRILPGSGMRGVARGSTKMVLRAEKSPVRNGAMGTELINVCA